MTHRLFRELFHGKGVKAKLLGIFIAICTAGMIFVGYFFNLIQPFIL